MNIKKYWWVFVFIAPFIGIGAASLQIYYGLYVWTYEGEPITFEIKSGETFGKINYRLGEQDLIFSKKLFHRYCQLKEKMTKFQVGRYRIETGTNMLSLIEQLSSGQSIQISVTIPEGKNLFQIANIVESKKICPAKEFINLAKNPSFVKQLNLPGERVEGYLYPDTYRFSEGLPCKDVISKMVETFNQQTKDVDFSASSFSKKDLIILASVVEKETGAAHERPMIAGVFHNRLRKRMRLQSDPTTIYGIYESFNGNLRKKHLQEKTPYNTYKISGLPIGPICNPGRKAIEAVLKPADHEFLFFVSQNDGTHVFAKNYADHRKNVDFFQKNYANRRGKSWRNLNKKSR